MPVLSEVEQLYNNLPPEMRGPTRELLLRVVHDLRTPTSTLTLDLYSARLLLHRVQGSGQEALLEELDSVCRNLQLATGQLADALTQLAEVSGAAGTPQVDR